MNLKDKITPGPWSSHFYEEDDFYYANADSIRMPYLFVTTRKDSRAPFDMKIASAAPEMLDILERLIEWSNDPLCGIESVNNISNDAKQLLNKLNQ